ncbi:hypothetical protein CRYUN_Cryun23aG0014900 [Craigia yunnanensis]
MNHRCFPSSLFPLPIIFVLQVMLGIPYSLGIPEAYNNCRDAHFKCGNISAGYPFSGDRIPHFCGHPGLQLYCENGIATIKIVNVRYQVLTINPGSQTLRIARQDLIKNNLCNPKFQNSSLDYKLFDLANARDYANVTLLYDCSNLTQTQLGNSNSSVNRSTGYNDWVLRNVNGSESCSTGVTVPILRSSLEVKLNYSSLLGGLQEGFEVKWKEDSQVCQKCKDTGGVCGFGVTNQTNCYCPNETNPLDEMKECPRQAYVFGKVISLPLCNVSNRKSQLLKSGIFCWR